MPMMMMAAASPAAAINKICEAAPKYPQMLRTIYVVYSIDLCMCVCVMFIKM